MSEDQRIRNMALFAGGIRLGIGAGLLAAPGFAGRVWVGTDAGSPGTMVFARAIGARDALLGAKVLSALQNGDPVKRWLQLGFIADGADAVATAIAAKHLTRGRRIAMPLIAGAVGVVGYMAAAALD